MQVADSTEDFNMLPDEILSLIDRMLKQQTRGIRTPQEVVDGAFGLLAYDAQFELVEPVMRLLMERFANEVKRWVECGEGHSQDHLHWMPYNDSRLVSEYYGGIAGGEYTPEQHAKYVSEMRFNVQQVANRVRDLLSMLDIRS
jgi:hypothetical protein